MKKPNRIYHPWWDWECFKAGFYNTAAKDLDKAQAEEAYRSFLADLSRFEAGMIRVMIEWPKSCEHFLTNTSLNRIAWLGQAAMCIETGVPACFRSGFKLLTVEQQHAADALAQVFLDKWEILLKQTA